MRELAFQISGIEFQLYSHSCVMNVQDFPYNEFGILTFENSTRASMLVPPPAVIPTWESVIPRHLDVDSIVKAMSNVWDLLTEASVPSATKLAVYLMLCVGALAGLFYLLGFLMRLSTLIDSMAGRWDINLGERGPIRHSRQNFCAILINYIEGLNIAEAWSDKRFANLEAEVVAEGGYYASLVGRLLRRPSFGQRKVPRLVDAIRASTECRILLVGEPGSGKSVAMRHLAVQLATRAQRATRTYQIPIYVNLRELPEPPADGPTAAYIADFIRDYAARDMISGDYVASHWDEYVRDGKWFFLLDSFDEIPEVMHAGAHSDVIDQYSLAIRRCLESMTRCRAVVASREYKAPSLQGWERFCILKLSPQLQEQLIGRSLIEDRETQGSVKRYVAASASDVFKNPMFLTLLCEDMKREKKAPSSEFDLLNRHVRKLLRENAKKLSSSYRVTDIELASIARRMAQSLALNPSLGLAPTFNQLCKELCTSLIDYEKLQMILNALVWMKVLRSDVMQAQVGDRRYAFFHRRYQEALVVDQLANGKINVSPTALLCEDHWREYTVTFLQSQAAEAVRPVIDEAVTQIVMASAQLTVVPGRFGNQDIQYFNLEKSRLVVLLQLLQEGLRNRNELRSPDLAAAVTDALARFWKEGDLVNRYTVLSISGLSQATDLEVRIRGVLEEPSEILHREAFLQLSYLSDVPADLSAWLRKVLANNILDAKSNVDLRRIEAIVARLPSIIGAATVWRRGRHLRLLIMLSMPIFLPVLGLLRIMRKTYVAIVLRKSKESGYGASDETSLHRPIFQFLLFLGVTGLVFTSLPLGAEVVLKRQINWTLLIALIASWGLYLREAISFRYRDSSAKLTPVALGGKLIHWHRNRKGSYFKGFAYRLGWVLGLFSVIGAMMTLSYFLARWLNIPLAFMVLVLYVSLPVFGFGVGVISILNDRRSITRMQTIKYELTGLKRDLGEVLLEAKNAVEARRWLQQASEELLSTEATRRAFVSWVLISPAKNDWRESAPRRRLREIAWNEAEVSIRQNRPANSYPEIT